MAGDALVGQLYAGLRQCKDAPPYQLPRRPEGARPAALLVADRRRFPLKYDSFRIGTAAVVLLVALRLSIGSHFLYEGLWKINHADEFSTRPLLLQAKGPFAPLFYLMVPDVDGRKRLALTETGESNEDKKVFVSPVYLNAWTELKSKFVDRYALTPNQLDETEKLFTAYEQSLEEYLTAARENIAAYFDSLDRFERDKAAGNNGASFQKKRTWDEQQKLRQEAGVWLNDLDKMGHDFQRALWDILDDGQKAQGMVPAPVPETEKLPIRLPLVDSRSEALDLLMTYGLTAIGACLLLGLFTPLASLAGGVFLISVLLTQPPWPSIYPPAPEVVGHAMIVDKNFVEMVALFLLAVTPVGRWGGLDFFLHQGLLRPALACCRRKKADEQEAPHA